MGMFTTMIAEDGTEWQIKCGHDRCEYYKIGESVGQEIDPDRAGEGYLLDGVYDGCDSVGDPNDGGFRLIYRWIIIKDGIFVCTEPCELGDDGRHIADYEKQAAKLYVKHEIRFPPISLWSERAWADKARKDESTARRRFFWKAESRPLVSEQWLLSAKHNGQLSAAQEFLKSLPPEEFVPEYEIQERARINELMAECDEEAAKFRDSKKGKE